MFGTNVKVCYIRVFILVYETLVSSTRILSGQLRQQVSVALVIGHIASAVIKLINRCADFILVYGPLAT